MEPIMMAKEFWLNSQLSIARFYGGIRIDGHEYMVIPGSGDLLRDDFIKYYKKLGRDRLMKILEANNTVDDKDLKAICEKALEETKAGKNNNPQQQELFK